MQKHDAYETKAQFCRILVIPFRRSAGDIFDVYSKINVKYVTYALQTLAKLKTTFGRNLLYWML
jgi:hypothetical protein